MTLYPYCVCVSFIHSEATDFCLLILHPDIMCLSSGGLFRVYFVQIHTIFNHITKALVFEGRKQVQNIVICYQSTHTNVWLQQKCLLILRKNNIWKEIRGRSTCLLFWSKQGRSFQSFSAVGTRKCEPTPPCLKVREFELIFCSCKVVDNRCDYKTRYPDLGCGYLVFQTLKYPIEVDLLYPD